MKKVVLVVALGLVAILVATVAAIGFFQDSIAKKGIETVGSQVTQVEVAVNRVGLSLFTGSGTLNGLQVGNPTGFKTPFAIHVGDLRLALTPSSLWSDKVVIKSIEVQAPEITFEGSPRSNNLNKILENLRESAGGAKSSGKPPASSSSAGKKLQVDELVVSHGKINMSTPLLGGRAASIPLPDIRLANLGAGPEGITPAELTSRVLKAISERTLTAVGETLAKAGTEALKGAEAAGTGAASGLQKTNKGVTKLFKHD